MFTPRTFRLTGGGKRIRTPDRLTPIPHFECGPFNQALASHQKVRGEPPIIYSVLLALTYGELARPAGFEPATLWTATIRSIP